MKLTDYAKRRLQGLLFTLLICGRALAQDKGGDGDEGPKPDSPGEAAEFRLLQQRDETGTIPPNALVTAAEQRKAMLAAPFANKQPAPVAGISPASWTWLGPGNIGGRIRSIVVHPTNANIMWVGSVGGGIWKTTNGGTSWAPLADFMTNLAVATLAIDPTNPNILYAGTGEGFYNFDGIQGAGIFKTTDGGTTWTQLASTTGSEFYFVDRISIAPNGTTILATTATGINRSTDGGTTWTKVLTNATRLSDIDFNPTDSTKAIVSGYGHLIFYSTDGGVTWTAPTTGLTAGTGYNGGRVEIAYAPSNPSIVYAAYDHASSNSGQIWKSTDGGVNFALVKTGTWLGTTGSQGWYANALWVDPTNPNTLIVGGLDLWKSTDGGVTLTQISQWFSAPSSAHADHHVIVNSQGYNGTTNKTVFFGNDGGIYKAADIFAVALTTGWTELNNNFGVTQFYGAAGNAASGNIVAGAQDNGTLRYTPATGTEGWTAMFGGDGGFCAADPTDPNYFYGEYVYLDIHRSSNAGVSSSYIYTGIGDANLNTNANFIAPFILDPNNANTLLGGGLQLWRSTNVKAATPAWVSIKASVVSFISAIAVAPGNSDIIWVGHNSGAVYYTTNGTAATPTWTMASAGLPARYCMRITIDPNNSGKVYVTFGGYSAGNVYRTTNLGVNWTNIGGPLPSAPVRSLVVPAWDSNLLYVGTEVGVFASGDAGVTWSPTNDGPANVAVDELFLMGGSLVAATHGRGLFKASIGPLAISPAALVSAEAGTATNQTITVSGGTAPYISLTVTAFNGGTTGLTGGSLTPNAGAGTVVVSGTPTATGTCTFTVNVTDTASANLSKNYTLTVVPAPPKVANYSFISSVGTYTGISGGTFLSGVGTSNDDDTYANVPIGFSFVYNGKAYTTLGVCANGYVAFGGAAPGLFYDGTSVQNLANALHPFSEDLFGKGAACEIEYLTTGAVGSRVYTIQWKDWGFWFYDGTAAGNSTGNDVNFQLKLFEGTNAIQFVYKKGSIVITQSPQVGLTGATAADFKSRTTTTNWSATSASALNTAQMTWSASVLPADGLTYTWTPPALSIAPTSLAAATAGTATDQVISVSGGTPPFTTFTVTAFSGGTTGLTVGNITTNSVAGTVTLSGTPTAAGTCSFTVNVTDTAGMTLTKNYSLTVLTLQAAWRLQYFGVTTNTGNAADTADPDGDGYNNLFEFTAGLVPNSSSSRFNLREETVSGQPGQRAIIFSPLVLTGGRAYVVKYKVNLTDATWLPLTSSSTVDVGTERTVTDLAATGGQRFYHVEITLP